MKDYYCSTCIYCEPTNNFMTGFCSYWGKMVFMTDGCSLDDDDSDIFDDLDDDF